MPRTAFPKQTVPQEALRIQMQRQQLLRAKVSTRAQPKNMALPLVAHCPFFQFEQPFLNNQCLYG